MPFVLPLLVLVVMIVALVDTITRREDQVKHLPKFAWVLFIVLLPLIGSILWFTIGREWDHSPREAMSFGDPRRWSSPETAPAPVARHDARSTEQQLADLEREIEIAKLEAELQRRRSPRAAADDL